MPNFDSRPPTDLGRSGFRLIRTPSAHPLLGHIVSDNLTGCRTHFHNQRTVPCEAPKCDSCENGIAWRWHGYVLLLLDATQELVIFECTARSSEAIAAYWQRYGTTRGAHMKASRVNSRPNGRVLIQCKPADLQKISLPEPKPIEKLLCHIWNIPENQVSQKDHNPRPPFREAVVDRDAPEIREMIRQANEYSAADVVDTGNGRKHIDPTAV